MTQNFNQELALARAATAIYHNVDRAIADGYVRAGDSVPGEGIHYANFALIDGNFEIDRPESLIYTEGPNGQLRLAGGRIPDTSGVFCGSSGRLQRR